MGRKFQPLQWQSVLLRTHRKSPGLRLQRCQLHNPSTRHFPQSPCTSQQGMPGKLQSLHRENREHTSTLWWRWQPHPPWFVTRCMLAGCHHRSRRSPSRRARMQKDHSQNPGQNIQRSKSKNSVRSHLLEVLSMANLLQPGKIHRLCLPQRICTCLVDNGHIHLPNHSLQKRQAACHEGTCSRSNRSHDVPLANQDQPDTEVENCPPLSGSPTALNLRRFLVRTKSRPQRARRQTCCAIFLPAQGPSSTVKNPERRRPYLVAHCDLRRL